MNRNLKALGLSLVAVLAMSGLVAAGAQGQSTVLTTEGTTEEIRAKSAAVTPPEFTRTGRAVACKTSMLDGSATNEHKTITTTVPTLAECTETVLNKTTTIDPNGCHFRFHLSHDANPSTFTANGELHCPTGKEMTVTVFNSSDHTATPLCTWHLPPQVQKGGTIDLTNKAAGTKFPTHPAVPSSEKVTAKNWIEAHVNITSITSTRTHGSALTCGAAHNETGVLEGTAEIYGETAGNQVGLTVSTK